MGVSLFYTLFFAPNHLVNIMVFRSIKQINLPIEKLSTLRVEVNRILLVNLIIPNTHQAVAKFIQRTVSSVV
jgi:hypothetical protein